MLYIWLLSHYHTKMRKPCWPTRLMRRLLRRINGAGSTTGPHTCSSPWCLQCLRRAWRNIECLDFESSGYVFRLAEHSEEVNNHCFHPTGPFPACLPSVTLLLTASEASFQEIWPYTAIAGGLDDLASPALIKKIYFLHLCKLQKKSLMNVKWIILRHRYLRIIYDKWRIAP